MKILHLISDLSRGGAQSMLARLVTHMDQARFSSVVVSLTDDGRLGPELRAAGVTVHGLGMRRGRPSVAGFLRLHALLRAERPDILQSWLYHADLLGLVAGALPPRPTLVWNLRCSDMDLDRYSRSTRAVRRLLAWGSARPAAVIVNSAAGRRYHQSIGYRPQRWVPLANGFDTDRFRPDVQARREWRARLGIADGQALIGMVARVDPMKDHATLLAAVEQVAQRHDIALLLVGQGTDTLPLPAALAGRVHALGDRGDVATILPALDLFILSSAFGEGFPNVIGEAMACGVPCIAGAVGDAADIIGDTGGTVPPRDTGALAAAIEAFLARPPAERASLGQAARARVLARYSIAVIVEQYQRFYEELAGAASSMRS